MSMDFTITDNSALFKAAKDEATEKAAMMIGLQAVGYAQMKAPTDTGLLKNSLTFALSGEPTQLQTYKADKPDSSGTVQTGSYSGAAPNDADNQKAVYIGSNVFYGPYQEFGTSKSAAQPFLKPAVADHIPEYKDMWERTLKGE